MNTWNNVHFSSEGGLMHRPPTIIDRLGSRRTVIAARAARAVNLMRALR